MLINPHNVKLRKIEGTRFLEDNFGLAGFEYTSKKTPGRVWTLQFLLEPIPNRFLGGIRAKFVDNKGFVSFCNQRDLEVIVGLGTPGEVCAWSGEEYAEEGTVDWYGLCVDEYDLDDDLFERELRMRAETPCLVVGTELIRLVHNGSYDHSEHYTLLTDTDELGYSPDVKLHSLLRRWSRIERTPVQWSLI